MLPVKAGNINLSNASKDKVQYFFDHFCEGEGGETYGIGHLIFACHASFPLLLSAELANLIWLNFKSYSTEYGTENIDRIAVSDFLLSPLVRTVSAKQFEVIPEIRCYLLYLLKDSRWFELFGIKPFREARLRELAQFLIHYIRDKKSQQENNTTVFKEVNEWAALAYLEPDDLAHRIAASFKRNINEENELGQLRLSLLMDRFGQQYDYAISDKTLNIKSPFINLHYYSRSRKAYLFDKETNAITDILESIDNSFIGVEDSSNSISLPIQKSISEKLKERKNKTQRILSLLIGIDKYNVYEDEKRFRWPQLHSSEFGVKKLVDFLQHIHEQGLFETSHKIVLLNERATRQNILNDLQLLYQSAGPEDICLIYYSGHAYDGLDIKEHALRLPDFGPENILVPYDHDNDLSSKGIASKLFYETKNSANFNNCQTIFLLDAHTGYFEWVGENDVFIGASRHTVPKDISSESVSIFFWALQKILEQTHGKITYKDLVRWINFQYKYGSYPVNETSVLLTSLNNINKYFLSKETAPQDNSYLMAYSSQQQSWIIMKEDFKRIPINSDTYVHEYITNQPVETSIGEIYTNDNQLRFGGRTDHLSKENIYKLHPQLPQLDSLVNVLISPESEKDNINRIIKEIQFDAYSSWGGMKTNGTHRWLKSNIIVEEPLVSIFKSDEVYHITYREETGRNDLSGVVHTLDQIGNWIKKLVRYLYLKELSVNDANFRWSEPIDINIILYWGAGYKLESFVPSNKFSEEISIDEMSFSIGKGTITFNPLHIQLRNNEKFSIFYDVYILTTDLAIKKVSAEKNNLLKSSDTVTIDIEDPALFEKIVSNEIKSQIKVLISRDPIYLDLSQYGTNSDK